jgi:hypothetical protein
MATEKWNAGIFHISEKVCQFFSINLRVGYKFSSSYLGMATKIADAKYMIFPALPPFTL